MNAYAKLTHKAKIYGRLTKGEFNKMNWSFGLTSALLIVTLIYFMMVLIHIKSWEKKKRLDMIITAGRKDSMKLFFFENAFMSKFNIAPEKIKVFIYIERVILLSVVVTCLMFLRGMAILIFGAILIIMVENDAYKNVIYESGITNVTKIVNFINYFVPHINSGNSADQSLLGYIDYSKDEDLAMFYENRDNIDYKLQPHIRQIVDIYDIAKYNESKGISDYTYILNELSQDYAQKQIYYNGFISRIGEIRPIEWSYYVAVPILIVASFSQTYDFWMGGGGFIVALLILILFGAFKFLIYKLKKDTVKVIF